jgi:hypothetical protein
MLPGGELTGRKAKDAFFEAAVKACLACKE